MSTGNRAKLRQMVMDVFLLSEDEFSWELRRADVETWDSLGVVSLAVAVKDTFGHHLAPQEATSITGIADLVRILESHGIHLDA